MTCALRHFKSVSWPGFSQISASVTICAIFRLCVLVLECMCVFVRENCAPFLCVPERKREIFIDLFSLVTHIIIQLFFIWQFCSEATIRVCKHILGLVDRLWLLPCIPPWLNYTHAHKNTYSWSVHIHTHTQTETTVACKHGVIIPN